MATKADEDRTAITVIPSARSGPAKRPQKPPARRVLSDNFEFEQDGVIYHTHAGEWVEFRGGDPMRVGDWFDAVKLQEAATGAESGPPTTAGEVAATFANTLRGLVADIVAWNWTNSAGEPYPSPPTYDVLLTLEMDEITWLKTRGRVATVEDRARPEPEDAEKNDGSGGSTSIAPSSVNRAQRRRRSG